MASTTYYVPKGGHPEQTQLLTDRAMFTEAYAVIPKGVLRDIVTSHLPFWDNMRMWVLSRPLSASPKPFPVHRGACAAAAVTGRSMTRTPRACCSSWTESSLTIEGTLYDMRPGSYAFIPPAAKWSVRNTGAAPVRFHWIRKGYQAVEGLPYPEAFVTNENDIEPIPMPGTDGKWVTTRFVDMSDMRHDMHVNIVTFEPGAVIPFAETHVMEHGLYVLEGKAVYRLNQDWVEVEAGDYMWLRAFCPQACYSGAQASSATCCTRM